MFKLNLSKEVQINGKPTKEISYNLDSLTSDSLELALKQCAKNQHNVVIVETDSILHQTLFAISAGLSYNDLKVLSLKDAIKAGSLVRDFLFIDSECVSTEATSEESDA